MSLRLYLTLAVSALTFGSASAAEPTVDEILAKVTQSIGGAEKVRSVHSLRTVSRLQVQGIEGESNVVSTMKTPQMVYTEITRPTGGTFIEAFDGHTKWAMPKGGTPKKLPDEEAKTYSDDTFVMVGGPLIDLKEKGHKAEYLGEETVNGKPTYKLLVTTKGGSTITYYLDTTTCLPVKQVARSERNGRETETIGYLLNYKTIDGFTMATSLLIKVGNAPPIHLKIDKFEYNFPVDEAMFHMPAIADSH